MNSSAFVVGGVFDDQSSRASGHCRHQGRTQDNSPNILRSPNRVRPLLEPREIEGGLVEKLWRLVRGVEADLHVLISDLQSDLLATVVSQCRPICITDIFLSTTRLEQVIGEVMRSTHLSIRTRRPGCQLSVRLQCYGRDCRVVL